MSYTPVNKVRIVTAASFLMVMMLLSILCAALCRAKAPRSFILGHNRSVKEIVETAIEEDVQGIAITSYQGGHVEFFKYMKDLLEENGCGHIKIFGGGGGTIFRMKLKNCISMALQGFIHRMMAGRWDWKE